jgi:hypothetical protein
LYALVFALKHDSAAASINASTDAGKVPGPSTLASHSKHLYVPYPYKIVAASSKSASEEPSSSTISSSTSHNSSSFEEEAHRDTFVEDLLAFRYEHLIYSTKYILI